MTSRSTSLILGTVLLFSCRRPQEPASSDRPDSSETTERDARETATEWETLFNGGSLNAFDLLGDARWNIIDDYVEADGSQRSYLVTKNIYSDFELSLEFWPSADANSGIYIRCQNSDAINAESGYEINIYDTNQNPDNRTGAIIHFSAPVVPVEVGEQWNTYEITAEGSHITVTLNDILVADLEDSTYASGAIALQNNGGLIRFRNVRVRRLE